MYERLKKHDFERLKQVLLDRLPHKPYCSDDLTHGLHIRSINQALKMRHIQLSPPYVQTAIIIDVDQPHALLAWEDNGNIPRPSWIAINPESTHAHYVYLLKSPILRAEYNGSLKALRYAAAIEALLNHQLSGDPLYSGLLTHNPLHPAWDTRSVHDFDDFEGYTLDELTNADIVYYRPKKRTERLQNAFGLGRNCSIFDDTRQWAYKAVLAFKRNNKTFDQWQQATFERVREANQLFAVPLPHNEARQIAKSIAKWVWFRFDERKKSEWHAKQNAKRKTHGAGSGRKFIIPTDLEL